MMKIHEKVFSICKNKKKIIFSSNSYFSTIVIFIGQNFNSPSVQIQKFFHSWFRDYGKGTFVIKSRLSLLIEFDGKVALFFAICVVKSSRFFPRRPKIALQAGSNLTNTTFSIEGSLARRERDSSGKTPGEEGGGGGRKERSLGFKVAINPLWPFLKPFGGQSGFYQIVFLDISPLVPTTSLESTRVLPSADFRLIATISADVGRIFTNSNCKPSKPREIDVSRVQTRDDRGSYKII